MVADY